MSHLTADHVEFLGKMATWLKNAPVQTVEYGTFYVGDVQVKFDGESAGHWCFKDDQWCWNPTP